MASTSRSKTRPSATLSNEPRAIKAAHFLENKLRILLIAIAAILVIAGIAAIAYNNRGFKRQQSAITQAYEATFNVPDGLEFVSKQNGVKQDNDASPVEPIVMYYYRTKDDRMVMRDKIVAAMRDSGLGYEVYENQDRDSKYVNSLGWGKGFRMYTSISSTNQSIVEIEVEQDN